MLLIFVSALAVCIGLTILVYSVLGRFVYANIVENDMRKMALMIADEAAKLDTEDADPGSLRLMMRSGEAKIVLLDPIGRPIELGRAQKPAVPETPDPEGTLPDGSIPEGSVPDGKQQGRPNEGEQPGGDEYVSLCSGILASRKDISGFTLSDNRHGLVVAEPILGANGENLGAVFVIRPITDVTSTARSLLIVLICASAAVGIITMIPLYFVTKRLTDPVEKLTKAASVLSSGDYSGRVEPEGPGEVRELGAAFNTLAESLEENIGALTVERNRLRAILDGMDEGIIGFGADGEVTKYNSSAAELLGGNETIESAPCFPEVKALAARAVENGETVRSSFKCSDRVIGVSLAPIEAREGVKAGAVALLIDVTEAERLEQTRRDYVANVSHELRTPLASIRGIADMLSDGLVESEEDKQRYYGYILRESIRLSTLINDLLELSRLQSGGVALKRQRFELYELIADVCDRMTDPAKEREMRIDLTIPEGRYLALSNPDRVEQVLITLVDNAVKHGDEGGLITVGMDSCENKWRIFVENPAEVGTIDLDRLFERFYKADESHSSEGTGLGLAIAEEVLELLGESIRADQNDGRIRFTFTVEKYV